MSVKRITSSSIEWAAFAKRVPKLEEKEFKAFKLKCDSYLRSVEAYPSALPKINWEHYSSRISVSGMVDDFKKKYEALQISYPKDTFSTAITEKEKKEMEVVKKAVQESNARIINHEAELKKWNDVIPFSEMTLEEYAEAFPDEVTFNYDKPMLFPFNPECQPGYVPKEEEEKDQH